MNLFESLSRIFLIKKNLKVEDKFSSFEIKYDIVNFEKFDLEQLKKFITLIPTIEHWSLNIKLGNSDSIILNNTNFKKFEEFEESIILERKTFEQENVNINFLINKKTKKHIYVYNFKSFNSFWVNTPITKLLNLFKQYQNSFSKLNFILLEQEIDEFYSEGISFLHGKTDNQANYERIDISDNCHFGNIEKYSFDPYFFKLISRPVDTNEIIIIFDKLSLLFSIISIFDITSITDDSLTYKLNGYKSYEGNLVFSKIDLKLNTLYFKIFDWIYSEKSNTSDKIGLVRNIISLSIQENSIEISDSVYLSIQSGYKAYLQENISKYIEIRNKIIDELSWISNKSGEIVAGHLSNYQKSIFTFLSFFISVFILRFLKGPNDEVAFNKEVTLFSLSFLLLSILFLYFSHWNLGIEKKRLKRKYGNIKNRYTDLLDKNDINRILREDSEFEYELKYIKERKKVYSILWIITLIVLISTILSVSDYLNWKIVYDWLTT